MSTFVCFIDFFFKAKHYQVNFFSYTQKQHKIETKKPATNVERLVLSYHDQKDPSQRKYWKNFSARQKEL